MTTPSNKKWKFFTSHHKLQTVVRWQMERRGMTHREAGEFLGVHETEISKYLRGLPSSVSDYRLMTLCLELGIEPTLDIKFNEKAI